MKPVANLMPATPEAMKSATVGCESGAARPDVTPHVIELLFRTFSRRFTTRWQRNFEDDAARELWLRDLRREGLSDEDVLRGLKKAATWDWPPSTGEFIRLCRLQPEDVGLPPVDIAYREAVQGAATFSRHQWSHAAVYYAATETGLWELRERPAYQTRPDFERAYQRICRRVLDGEELAIPEPPLLPERVSTRTPEAKEQAIAKCRRILKTGGNHEQSDATT